MPMVDLETELSDEERTIQETIHRFAAEVMRPAGIKLDALADPADVIAKDSILWDVFEKHRALGLDDATDPAKAAEQGLTPLQQARLRCIIAEEQGWGDSGLAISFGVDGFPGMLAQISQNPELIERFGGPDVRGCWAITEPDHGSDVLFYGMKAGVEAPGRPNCIAKKDGDSYTVLAANARDYRPFHWYQTRITLNGPTIAVYLDGDKELEASDEGLSRGMFALHAWGCAGAKFRNIVWKEY